MRAGNWSDSGAAGPWRGNGNPASGYPGSGDTVTINHAVTQDVPGLIIGVNGAAPVTSYLQSITGGGGTGYTSCRASLSGGTAVRGGGVGCYVTSEGAVTPYIYDRGVYSACPSITVSASGGTGATLPGAMVCATAGGTAAIKIGANGTLTVAANTYVRGTLLVDSAYNDFTNAFAISPGVTLYMDMTQAAGAMYRIEGTNNYWRLMTTDCTSTQCSVQGYGGSTSIDSASSSYGLCVTFKNTLFKNVGDAYTFGIYTQATGSVPTYWPNDLENNVFDTGGVIAFGASSGGAGVTFAGNMFQNTPVRYQGDTLATNVFIAYGTANSGGVRLFKNNVMDRGVQNPGNNVVGLKDYTVTGNVFGGGLNLFASTSASPALFQHNFWRIYAPPGWANYNFAAIASSIDDVYMFLDSAHGVNPHQIAGMLTGNAITNFIGGFSGRNTGDSGEWTPPTSVSNSLFLCDASGQGSSEIASTQGTGGTYLHNTRCGGYGGFGSLQTNETTITPAGSVTYKSNLTFETAQGSGISMKFNDVANPLPGTQDICATTNATTSNCDHNAGYAPNGAGGALAATQAVCPGCTNQGRSYAGLWSYTPGYHDVDGQDPMFVDATRKVENWDQKYLGKPLAPQWSAGGTYNYGDLASNSDPQVYQGEVFNFRCINPSGCSTLEAPGAGYAYAYTAGTSASVTLDVPALHLAAATPVQATCNAGNVPVSGIATTGSPYLTSVTISYPSAAGVGCYVASPWRADWEWASLYWLRTLTGAGASFTDDAINCTGCSAIEALNNWVRAGFSPTNLAYHGAAHDGGDIGAVQMKLVTVTIASTPPGLGLVVDGAGVVTPAVLSWVAGSQHTVTAAPIIGAGNATEYVFQNWSQGGAASQTITAPYDATTYTANYQVLYLVTSQVSPAGAGTVAGAGYVSAGSVARLTATAGAGYNFVEWSGYPGGPSAANPLSLTVNAPVGVVADLSPQLPQLTAVIASHSNTGGVETITVNLQNTGLGTGTNVTITSIAATVASGSGTLGAVTPIPQSVGTIPAGTTVNAGPFTFACPATVGRIKLVVGFTAAGGYSGSTTSTIFK